jgi:uncharacterized protein YlxW (UPF0749 family)
VGQRKKKKKIELNIAEDAENVNSLQFMHLSVLQLEKKISMIENKVEQIKQIMDKQDSQIKDKVRVIKRGFEDKLKGMGLSPSEGAFY